MSDLREQATYKALAAPRTMNTEPSGWLPTIAAVIAGAGSVAGAARDLGVPRRTLRRWITGESTPPADRQAQVQRIATVIVRRARVTQQREKRLRKGKTVTITAVYRYDDADAEREIKFRLGTGGSTGMDSGAVDQVVDAFLRGDNELFGPFAAGMTDGWYRERFESGSPDYGFDVTGVKIK